MVTIKIKGNAQECRDDIFDLAVHYGLIDAPEGYEEEAGSDPVGAARSALGKPPAVPKGRRGSRGPTKAEKTAATMDAAKAAGAVAGDPAPPAPVTPPVATGVAGQAPVDNRPRLPLCSGCLPYLDVANFIPVTVTPDRCFPCVQRSQGQATKALINYPTANPPAAKKQPSMDEVKIAVNEVMEKISAPAGWKIVQEHGAQNISGAPDPTTGTPRKALEPSQYESVIRACLEALKAHSNPPPATGVDSL